ncbi:hypothetical protein [Sphingobium yanoikuyae]|uniref:Uncharacterized protein n=1 Tax=Sphingobium yanoikuyae TaxID=13690 RepID=A0A9X7UE36_SPHYA|nr:hypothetical protein [Sphingobium yanoikuyae]QNG44700.1 hypothetical protein H3V42_23060 [Sphingobium yanoikuyae]
MNGNLNPSMATGVVAVINPVSQGAGTVTTGWIDMQKFGALLAILAVGALGASATVDAKIEQATDAAGAGAKDVAGSAITQLTKAGTDDNKQVLINLRQEDLDKNNAFRFVRLSVTVGTAASLVSAIVLAFNARYGAATDNDAATVDEIVS